MGAAWGWHGSHMGTTWDPHGGRAEGAQSSMGAHQHYVLPTQSGKRLLGAGCMANLTHLSLTLHLLKNFTYFLLHTLHQSSEARHGHKP